MGASALVGRPPATPDDELVVRGLRIIAPELLPAIPMLEQHGDHHSRSNSLVIGTSFAIAIVTAVTAARVGIRWSRLGRLGADDLVIIPACAGCVISLGLVITSATVGCMGRHIYTCTYQELAIANKASTVSAPLLASLRSTPYSWGR